MNTHSEQFFDFLKKLNEQNVRYVLIRGFGRFPESADGDVDIVYDQKDETEYLKIKLACFEKGNVVSFGSGEWCEMLYLALNTKGPKDPNIAGGRFRVDSYNSLYFKSPYKNFTTFWTVPKPFNDLVLETRIEKDMPYGKFYIPESECELVLLLLRNVLDREDKSCFSEKHIKRIKNILPFINREKLIDRLSMVLPHPEKIVNKVYEFNFSQIFDTALGYT